MSQILMGQEETAEPWLRADYSPFKIPVNSYRRFSLTTTLYFLRTPSRPTWLKIGIATDAARRLWEFQAGNPDAAFAARRTVPRPLDRQVERLIHQELAHCARGREWFEVSLADATAIADPLVRTARKVAEQMRKDGLFGHLARDNGGFSQARLAG